MSATLDPVLFSHLNIHVRLDVFKYLTLKERVRYERVQRAWREPLDMLWRQQRAVCLISKNKYCRNRLHYVLSKGTSCAIGAHHFNECDTVVVKSSKKRPYEAVLRRCG